MKYMKFVLLVLCALVISLNVNAKEEKYGNVTLRSIGVGNIHKKPIQQQFVTPNNSNNNYYIANCVERKTVFFHCELTL